MLKVGLLKTDITIPTEGSSCCYKRKKEEWQKHLCEISVKKT